MFPLYRTRSAQVRSCFYQHKFRRIARLRRTWICTRTWFFFFRICAILPLRKLLGTQIDASRAPSAERVLPNSSIVSIHLIYTNTDSYTEAIGWRREFDYFFDLSTYVFAIWLVRINLASHIILSIFKQPQG